MSASYRNPKPPRCKGFMRHVWVTFRGKIACNRCLKPRNPKAKPLTKAPDEPAPTD